MSKSKKSKPAPKTPPAKAAHAKAAPAKAAPAKKAPPPPRSAAPKTPPAAKPKPAPAAKAPAAAKPAAPAKPAPEPRPAAAAEKPVPSAKTGTKADSLRARILERRSSKPIAFTLDEVREIAKTSSERPGEPAAARAANGKNRPAAAAVDDKIKKAALPHHVKPASLNDILGYSVGRATPVGLVDPEKVDPKFQRYYRLLLELRDHVVNGLNTHAEETLKRSAKDDSGDLSGYAQHMADAGTDTFDRDFALSLVSNEQEALAEIDAAIQRIHNGTYGICELTGKPISKDRLQAVPFARFSVESQAEYERTRRRSSNRSGVFGETAEEGGKIEEEGGGEE